MVLDMATRAQAAPIQPEQSKVTEPTKSSAKPSTAKRMRQKPPDKTIDQPENMPNDPRPAVPYPTQQENLPLFGEGDDPE